jgi:hypothetical protein
MHKNDHHLHELIVVKRHAILRGPYPSSRGQQLKKDLTYTHIQTYRLMTLIRTVMIVKANNQTYSLPIIFTCYHYD